MKNYTYFQALLLRSFDETLRAEEQLLLDEALQTQPKLVAEQQQIVSLREYLGKQTFTFEPHFADRVTNQIYQKTTNASLSIDIVLMRYFPRLALAGIVTIAVLMAQAYKEAGNLSLDTLSGNYEMLYDEAGTIINLSM